MKSFSKDGGKYMILFSSILLAIAAFLPWGKAFGETVSNGLAGDGVITLGIAILVFVLVFVPKVPLWVIFTLGFISAAISAIVVYNFGLQSLTAAQLNVEISSGIGVYLSIVAGLGIAIAAVYQRKLNNHYPSFAPLGLSIVGALLVLIAAMYPGSKVPTLEISILGAIFLVVGGILEAHCRIKKSRA